MVGSHGTSHTTPGKSKTCSSFCPSMLDHYWKIVWPVWIWPPCSGCLYNAKPISPMNTLMHWEGFQDIYGWLDLIFTTHYLMQRMKCPSFHPSTHGTSFGLCMASMDVISLLWLLVHGPSLGYCVIILDVISFLQDLQPTKPSPGSNWMCYKVKKSWMGYHRYLMLVGAWAMSFKPGTQSIH